MDSIKLIVSNQKEESTILTHLAYRANAKKVIDQIIVHKFERARKMRAIWCHLLLQNDDSHDVR